MLGAWKRMNLDGLFCASRVGVWRRGLDNLGQESENFLLKGHIARS